MVTCAALNLGKTDYSAAIEDDKNHIQLGMYAINKYYLLTNSLTKVLVAYSS